MFVDNHRKWKISLTLRIILETICHRYVYLPIKEAKKSNKTFELKVIIGQRDNVHEHNNE